MCIGTQLFDGVMYLIKNINQYDDYLIFWTHMESADNNNMGPTKF